ATDALDDLAAASADEAGQAHDLAPAHGKGNIAEAAGLRQPTDLEDDLVGSFLGPLLGRVEVIYHPPDHGADHRAGGGIGHGHGGNVLPVPKHCHAVAVLEDLGHAMGNVDDGNALGGEPVHDLEQHPGFA